MIEENKAMPKISLKSVKGNSYYSDGYLSIGAYIHNNAAILFDSGNDENSAKDVHAALQEKGYEVTAIINTHCHADHCGGNHFFQKKNPQLKVYAAHDEKEAIENPHAAPRCFCMGAAPFAGLKNKWLAPQKSSFVTHEITSYQDQTIEIDGAQFKIITLQGHTHGSVGIITPDNVLYSGDALFGADTLAKHPILLYTDIASTFASFKKLSALQIDACVMYHGGQINNLAQVVKQHEDNILAIKDSVFGLIKEQALSIDELTQKIMQKYAVPNNIISFTLTQTAMRAYVTYLESEKLIELVVSDGLLRVIAIK